ncbi:MAG: hypothetical protein LAT84_08045 [Balneolia bacterium]|nr:hypothetical protein [Balneolia bacterium]
MTSETRINLLPAVFILLPILLFACNRTPSNPWTEAIPSSATVLYTFEEGTTLSTALNSGSLNFLNEISEADLQLVTEVENATTAELLLTALFIEPTGANQWSPVWIGSYRQYSASDIAERFKRAFTQNSYQFHGQTIHRLFLQDGSTYFAAQVNNYILVSPNSGALESGLKSYLGRSDSMQLPSVSEISGNRVFVNYSGFGDFAKQLGAPRFRPLIEDAFKGLQAAEVSTNSESAGNGRLTRFNSTISNGSDVSVLVRELNGSPATLRMDRYIPSDAAVFGMFSTERLRSAADGFEPLTGLDSLLVDNENRISRISSALGNQAGFAGFYTLGFSPLEETVFVRQVSDRSAIREELDRLVSDGEGQQTRSFYSFRSHLLAQILGSRISPYQDFIVGLSGDFLVIAPRSGLVQRVINDVERRRVLFFDDEYVSFRSAHPEQLSSFFYVDNQSFRSFIEPYTDPASNAMTYTQFFDVLTFSSRSSSGETGIQMDLHQLERTSRPFVDRWYFPVSGAELTGPAVVGNLFQESRNDVVFATDNNRVIAVASDGTEIFTASTGEDTPIGSPVIYDWYANNQQAVLVAAGNKIYGWNNRGQLLPNFPFELSEQITSPLLVADISRSGLPEAIVATADRNLHVLSGRGTSLNGWPQTANSVIRHKPVIETFDGNRSLWAFAENAVLGWNPDGTNRSGFPVFTDAPLMGEPVINNNRIFAGGADGNLYAISREGVFDAELNILSSDSFNGNGSMVVQAVNASDSPLYASQTLNMRVRISEENDSGETSTRLEQMNVIAAYSQNGSVFLYSLDGRLRFTRSMGQPASEHASLIITDLNRDNRQELIAVTQVGRMYAWTVETASSYDGLPTTAIRYPVATRLGSDGLINIIGGTRDGIRTWAVSN